MFQDCERKDRIKLIAKKLRQLVRVAHHIVVELSGPDAEAIVEAGKRLVAWHEEGLEDHEPSLRSRVRELLEMEPFWQAARS